MARTSPVQTHAARGPSWIPWTLLALAVVAVGVSAIIIRYAQEAHPLALSFWRCLAGAVLLAPFARRGFRRLDPGDLKLPVVAGIFLALHFATWITSLELTSVANSVLLVTTAPVFVALAARYFLKEQMRPGVWIGIFLALGGTALIAGAGSGGGETSLSGDLLALIGAVLVAGYGLAGQVSRRKLGIAEYAVITYGAGAVALLPVCLVAGVELGGYSTQTWVAIAAMVIGPQILGHTILNYVVKEIDATTIYAAVMAEPPIAIALAFVLFDEVPSLLVYPGGVAILIGILMVSLARRERTDTLDAEHAR